ncbi:nuclear speckle splicing regulatory protein 1 [Erythrolamprus reginae]|uniref:nuclear speckle splicing regulatory protein 1 n=1 Tax=Erythrolamprus reginae TaxID=121349 RepID=UPI00396C93FC
MAAPGKQYGLIFPKKVQQKGLVKHAAFMDDSDDESSISESLQKEAAKKQAMKQTKMEIQRALAEDSTVYEYDAIYEDIQKKKEESQASSLAGKAEKKPKYIQNILQAAELRKKEQERRMEKKIQKEREAEGEAFQDKMAFVTSAYKKKLQERAEEEERERKEAAIEASLDVTKQKDLSGFYRHLLNQTVGEEKMPHCSLRGAGVKGEDPTEKPAGSHQSLENETGTCVPGMGEENLDADSDSRSDSSGGEEGILERRGERKASGADDGDLRGCPSKPKTRDSRSPSEERPPRSPPPEKRDRRRDETHRRDERKRHGKDERSHHRRREERHRRKNREEEEEEEEEEEKRDQKRGRDKKEHRSREKDRDGDREKGRGRDADRDEKHARKRSSGSVTQEDPQTQGGNLPGPEKSPELTDKPSEDNKETQEKPDEKLNKFAKRSNQATVSSARDRYLSRQVARVGSKPYVEKEED